MMNGKTKIFIGSLFLIGFVIGKINSKQFINQKTSDSSNASTQQYLNRLSEFFIDDLSVAKNDFFELLDMGFNPNDCFEITIAKSNLL
jgi:hypothetical protein